MREIELDFALELLRETADVSLPSEFEEMRAGLGVRQRELFPYVYNLFANILGFKNVADFLNDVFGKAEELCARDLQLLAPHLVTAKRVVDVGCGWGAMTTLLRQHFSTESGQSQGEVYAVDYVLEHAVATKILNPQARVFQADARFMSCLPDGYFDFVLAHGVIEHVGDHAVPVGGSGPNLKHQCAFVRELARITRLQGKVFLSTGNYLFPFDGETNLWFYHWLPTAEKDQFNAENKRSTDKYWLLDWDELSYLLEAAGLEVDSVAPPPGERWNERFFNALSVSMKDLDADMLERWKRLTQTDPRFFSSWLLVANKTRSPSAVPEAKNNPCRQARSHMLACTGVPVSDAPLHKRLGELERDNEALRAQVEALTSSTSWKVTAPLRRLRSLLTGKQ